MALTKVHDRISEGSMVNVFDYMTSAQIADVKANTASVDVTAAIQSAVDAASNNTVYFPAGTYLTSSTITADNTSFMGQSAFDLSEIKYTATDGSAAVAVSGYYNNGYYTTFTNMSFIGAYENGSATQCTGLYLYNNDDDDIDAYVNNCKFAKFRKSIHIKGRGLTVNQSVFVVTLDAFYLDRVIPVNDGPNSDQKINSGARVYQFYNNRFHGMGGGSCVSNVDAANTAKEYTRGIHFVGNYIDTSARIMNGPCRESLFSNNMHLYPDQSQTLFYSSVGDWYDINISNNVFTSWRNAPGGAGARFNKQILFQQDNIEGLVFADNVIYNVEEDVLRVEGNLLHATVTGNKMANVILKADTAAYRPLYIGGDASRIQFNNNIIEMSASGFQDYLVYVVGSSANVDTSNNGFNNALLSPSNVGGYINPLRKINYGNAAPTTGPWNRGDIILNSEASAAGNAGWICIVSGTPGTWKTFGTIAS